MGTGNRNQGDPRRSLCERRQVGLAHAAGAEQQQVLGTVQPVGVVGELLDLMAIEIGDGPPVDLGQGLGHRQLRLMQQPPQPCLVALLVLLFGQHIEVAGGITALGARLLFGRLPLAAELRQFQLLEKGRQGCFQRRPSGGLRPGVRHSC